MSLSCWFCLNQVQLRSTHVSMAHIPSSSSLRKISRVLDPVASPVQFGPFLCEFPKSGRETWIRVTFLGDGAGCGARFPLQCLGTKQPWVWKHTWLGAGFLSPGQAGRRAWSTQSLTECPVWCPSTQAGVTGWLEPRAQEVKREWREHMTVVVGQADASLRPLAS